MNLWVCVFGITKQYHHLFLIGFLNADRLGKVYSRPVALLFAARVVIVQWVVRNVVRTTFGTLMSWRHLTKYGQYR